MKEPDYYFPFLAMKDGDSFVIPTNSPEIIRNIILREAKRFGVKVKISCRVEEGILCVRCWMLVRNERPDA
jgi:hypothetical protein